MIPQILYEELITHDNHIVYHSLEMILNVNVYKTIKAIRFQELIKLFSSIYSDSIEFIIR